MHKYLPIELFKDTFRRKIRKIVRHEMLILQQQETVMEYAAQFNLKCLVETGTFLGDMIKANRNLFEEVYSIEIDLRLYKRAKEIFQGDPNVHILLGDSRNILPTILPKAKALFWLDAHNIKERTYKPILEELDAIFKHGLNNNVILIDDTNYFYKLKWINLDILIQFIKNKCPESHVDIKDNIIRVHQRGGI